MTGRQRTEKMVRALAAALAGVTAGVIRAGLHVRGPGDGPVILPGAMPGGKHGGQAGRPGAFGRCKRAVSRGDGQPNVHWNAKALRRAGWRKVREELPGGRRRTRLELIVMEPGEAAVALAA